MGLAVQVPASLLLLAGSGLAILQATQVEAGPTLLIYLLLTVLLLAPLPVLGYRIYALWLANYSLERDGLHLRWGLRSEDIPLNEITWVHPISDLAGRLPLPWFCWPGAFLGARQVHGLGSVEFMAADRRRMVLVGTRQRVYAISPAHPDEFIRIFQRTIELGSLSPMAAQSVSPSFLVNRAWADPTGRILLVSGLVLELALLTLVSLSIPGRTSIALGFDPSGLPATPGPAAALMLLPVLNTINLVVDLAGGFFFYRLPDQKPLAYLLWASAVISPLLLLLAVYTILR